MTSTIEKPPATSVARVIVLDNIADEGLATLESTPGIEFEIQTGLSGRELQEALREFDGAVCRSGVKITAESLEGNQRLKAIVRAGVGTDNIDKQAATRLGIIVMNTPTGNTISTAELTMTMALGLSRHVAPAHASLADGKWDRKKFQGNQVFGKTIGIVGLGRIGQEVAVRAKAFGMSIVGYDPFMTADRAIELGIDKRETVGEILPLVDYLTVHTPLTPETRGLIGDAEIEKLKPGARLINCARGGIYDEQALVRGLESGKLAGVALDVYENEPCTDSPLFSMPNVLSTPHLGASTAEAQVNVAVEAVDLLINFLQTGEIRQAVNTTSVDPQTLKAMRDQLDVAARLGSFLSQWHDQTIERCELVFKGEINEQDTRLLTTAFCAGLLENACDSVSIVNAEVLAADRGIEITRSESSEHCTFSSLISARVTGGGKTLRADGTVFGRKMPRLVQLNDYPTDAYLDGNLLVFTHQDVPGIIGYVGKILADENVNIAQMAVGRQGKSAGGGAIGVLNIDVDAPESALTKITEHEGVESVRPIKLLAQGQTPKWMG